MTNLGVRPATKGGMSPIERAMWDRVRALGGAISAVGPINSNDRATALRSVLVANNPSLASILRSLNLPF